MTIIMTIQMSVSMTALTGLASLVRAQNPMSFDYPGDWQMLSTFNKILRSLLRSTGALVLGIASLILPHFAVAQTTAGWDVVANFNSANNPAASSTFTYGSGV